MKNNVFFITLSLLTIVLFNSCNKDDEPIAPVRVEEFLGNYTLGQGSYHVELDTSGNPIASSQTDIAGETLIVTLNPDGGFLTFESPTLGQIRVIPQIDGQKVNLTISDQPYFGSLNPAGGNATIRTTENFYFTKESNGKKYLDSKSGNGNFMLLLLAGNKYQVSIRRTGVS